METLANKKLSMDEKKSPFIKHWHWENGKSVSYCTMGMSVPNLDYSGGTTTKATAAIVTILSTLIKSAALASNSKFP